jgi:hypothetical protein
MLTFDIQSPDWLPPDLVPLWDQVMRELPAFPDRRTAADVWTRRVHSWSHRTLERAPIPTVLLNGRRCFSARKFLEYGFRRLVESPPIRGGRRPPTEGQAASDGTPPDTGGQHRGSADIARERSGAPNSTCRSATSIA